MYVVAHSDVIYSEWGLIRERLDAFPGIGESPKPLQIHLTTHLVELCIAFRDIF